MQHLYGQQGRTVSAPSPLYFPVCIDCQLSPKCHFCSKGGLLEFDRLLCLSFCFFRFPLPLPLVSLTNRHCMVHWCISVHLSLCFCPHFSFGLHQLGQPWTVGTLII